MDNAAVNKEIFGEGPGNSISRIFIAEIVPFFAYPSLLRTISEGYTLA
jgi:hypothetical protein